MKRSPELLLTWILSLEILLMSVTTCVTGSNVMTQFTFYGFHSGKRFNSNAQPFPQCTPPRLDYDCAPCCIIHLSLGTASSS